jgi:hypothetical protein
MKYNLEGVRHVIATIVAFRNNRILENFKINFLQIAVPL